MFKVLPEILKNSDFEFNKLDVSLRKRLPAQSCKKISLDNLGFPYRPDTDNATDFTEEDQQEADTSKMEIASAFVIMEKVKQKYGEVKPDSHYFNSTGTIR